VLPQGLKASSVDSIAREYEWVLAEFKGEPASPRGRE
jgi:hypothetical protein